MLMLFPRMKLAAAIVLAPLILTPQTTAFAAGPDQASAAAAPYFGMKGVPGAGVASGNAAAGAAYFYATGYQYASAAGASATVTINKPKLLKNDYHSLAELAVESADGAQIVEVGWTVDKGQFGDADPHLFVYHWVDGTPSCYNGCGWVPTSTRIKVGMNLKRVASASFGIRHSVDRWVVSANTIDIGYFPDSLWGGRYTEAGLVQWFGEVAARASVPCSQMGNGKFAENPNAALFSDMALVSGPAPDVTPWSTNVYYTEAKVDATSMRFGGPAPACA